MRVRTCTRMCLHIHTYIHTCLYDHTVRKKPCKSVHPFISHAHMFDHNLRQQTRLTQGDALCVQDTYRCMVNLYHFQNTIKTQHTV
jgi:hypothetical protein